MPRPKIDPVVWRPPKLPARAKLTQGTRPLPPPWVIPVSGVGPEDVVLDADGHLITGVEDGRILRISNEGRQIEQLADTGGRPLGIELLPDGRLLVCDANRGLLTVDPDSGSIDVLAYEVDGRPMLFCNNAAVARDGTVYFSDSSRRFGIEHWRAEMMEHSGTGRLLRLDPAGTVSVVMDGLQFANGVALAADESFVAVAETGSYQVRRLWLTGPSAGSADMLVSNLPAVPDNMSTGSDGLIWIALPSHRPAALDWLHGKPPILRRLAWALPEGWQPKESRVVWVMAVDDNGHVVHDLQGPGDRFHVVTGVRERAGRVYLGSLVEPAVAVLDLRAGSSPS
ncbi:MAG TPA: SMP-30/gluconolactonase/LRE family protein [Pseudonocardiaceae bacterium]|jgi:sugar lactone lactonase YvrE